MNNPPFSIGQKVVCLTTFPGYIYKNEIYTIAETGYCPYCKIWHVTILELITGGGNFLCVHCDYVVIPGNKHKGCTSKHFAPIQAQYADATAEILEKFKSPNETPDKILTPEKVNN